MENLLKIIAEFFFLSSCPYENLIKTSLGEGQKQIGKDHALQRSVGWVLIRGVFEV